MEFRRAGRLVKLYRSDCGDRSMVGSIPNDATQWDEVPLAVAEKLTEKEKKQVRAWLRGAESRVAAETADKMAAMARKLLPLRAHLSSQRCDDLWGDIDALGL